MQVTVEEVTQDCDFAICMAIRMDVFVFEQSVPAEEEWDAYDKEARHFFARVDGRPAATARLRAVEGAAKIERMAVRRDFRGKGVGEKLMEYVMEAARAGGMEKVVISAQTHAVPFYEKLGFAAHGDEYMEAGIPHYAMARAL